MEYENTQNTAKKPLNLKGLCERQFDGKQVTVPKMWFDHLSEKEKVGRLVIDDRHEYKKLVYIPEETYMEQVRQAKWQEDNEEKLRMLDTAVMTSIANGKLTIPEAHQKTAEVEPGTVVITGRKDRFNIYGAKQHEAAQALFDSRSIYDQPEDYE